MARTKPSPRSRTLATWTAFQLSNDPDLAQQTSSLAIKQRSILSQVSGFTDARVGQRHGHPEQGAFLIWWETEESIREFYKSEVYGQYLQQLACAPEAPFLQLKHVSAGNIMRNLNGLVTLTKLLPAPEAKDSLAFQDVLEAAFLGWAPKSTDPQYGFRPFTSQTWASASFVGSEDVDMSSSNCDEDDRVRYHIFSWDGNCSSPERDLAAALSPISRASFEGAIGKAGHMVRSWEQDVWQFKRLPSISEPGRT